MRIVGYARLSTQEQAEGQALEQQIDRLRRAGATPVIHDLDSGSKDRREGFTRLLDLVKGRQVDRVVATRLDRLSRRAAITCALADLFGADDAPELQLLDDGIDARTIGGRTMIRMLGTLAQQELERIRVRGHLGGQATTAGIDMVFKLPRLIYRSAVNNLTRSTAMSSTWIRLAGASAKSG